MQRSCLSHATLQYCSTLYVGCVVLSGVLPIKIYPYGTVHKPMAEEQPEGGTANESQQKQITISFSSLIYLNNIPFLLQTLN